MSAGWLLLAPTSWAIITARKSTLKKEKRVLLTQLHAATVFLGVVCATLGGVAIYLNKVCHSIYRRFASDYQPPPF